jgi:hypothetical protein
MVVWVAVGLGGASPAWAAQLSAQADWQVMPSPNSLGSEPRGARYGCIEGDGGAGLLACAGSQPNGGTIDTSEVGGFMFTVTAISRDGQRTSRTVQYSVLASNSFTVSEIRTFADGTVSFAIKVPGPGSVDALETAWSDNLAKLANVAQADALLQPAAHRFVFARAHTQTAGARTIDVVVKPNPRGALLVQHHPYRIPLRLWITYTPTGGRAASIGIYGLHLGLSCAPVPQQFGGKASRSHFDCRAAPALGSQEFTVPSTAVPDPSAACGSGPVDTGINLGNDQSAVIDGSGQATWATTNGYLNGPGGDPSSGFVGPYGGSTGGSVGGLIGEVGSNGWISIGTGPTTIAGPGELYLGFDDNVNVCDNAGSFIATVTVVKS